MTEEAPHEIECTCACVVLPRKKGKMCSDRNDKFKPEVSGLGRSTGFRPVLLRRFYFKSYQPPKFVQNPICEKVP